MNCCWMLLVVNDQKTLNDKKTWQTSQSDIFLPMISDEQHHESNQKKETTSSSYCTNVKTGHLRKQFPGNEHDESFTQYSM